MREPDDFSQALTDVVATLPSRQGTAQGAVFIQPLIDAETGGVTFFDGFYYEETAAAGGNRR